MIKIEPLAFCNAMIEANSIITNITNRGKYTIYKTNSGYKYQIVQDTTNGMVVQINIAY